MRSARLPRRCPRRQVQELRHSPQGARSARRRAPVDRGTAASDQDAARWRHDEQRRTTRARWRSTDAVGRFTRRLRAGRGARTMTDEELSGGPAPWDVEDGAREWMNPETGAIEMSQAELFELLGHDPQANVVERGPAWWTARIGEELASIRLRGPSTKPKCRRIRLMKKRARNARRQMRRPR